MFLLCSHSLSVEDVMVQRSIPVKKIYERDHPFKVDVPVGPLGLGKRLTAMEDWLRCNGKPGRCAQHGHHDRKPGQTPLHWARFYFRDETIAERFQKAFASDGAVLRHPGKGEA